MGPIIFVCMLEQERSRRKKLHQIIIKNLKVRKWVCHRRGPPTSHITHPTLKYHKLCSLVAKSFDVVQNSSWASIVNALRIPKVLSNKFLRT